MAETTDEAAEPATHEINVRVLSQLPEPHTRLEFSSLPSNTTIGELKLKIRDAIPSSPPAENQRIIYRARRVGDSDLLIDLFGRETLGQGTVNTLHLVIREQQSQASESPQPQVAAAAPHNASQEPTGTNALPQPQRNFHATRQGPAVLPQSPYSFRSFAPSQGQAVQNRTEHQTTSQPQIPTHTGQFPPGLPNMNTVQHAIQQNMRAAHQTMIAQYRATQNRDGATLQPNGQNLTQPQPSAEATANGESAAQDQNQVSQDSQNTTPSQASVAASGHNEHNTSHVGSPASAAQSRVLHSPGQNTIGTVTQDITGPNGERWTIVTSGSMQSQTTQMAMPPAFPNPFTAGPVPQQAPFPPPPFTYSNPGPFLGEGGTASNLRVLGSPPNIWLGPAHAIEQMQMYERQVDEVIRSGRIAHANDSTSRPVGMTIPDLAQHTLFDIIHHRNARQVAINQVMRFGSPDGIPGLSETDVATLQTLNGRFARIITEWRTELQSMRERGHDWRLSDYLIARSNGTTQLVEASDLERSRVNPPIEGGNRTSEETSSSLTDPVTAYILYSPNGTPHTVVYSPQGTFAATRVNTASQTLHQRPGTSIQPSALSQIRSTAAAANPPDAPNQGPNMPNANAANAANVQPRQAGARQGEPQNALNDPFVQQFQQLQQQQGVNAVAINLTPFFQALWLFIRVYGVMWLFLGGSNLSGGWFSWRMLTLLGVSLLYWGVQAGVGAGQAEAVRRYWNELIAGGNDPERPERRGGEAVNDENHRPQEAQPPNTSTRDAPVQQTAGQAQVRDHNIDDRSRAPRNALREWFRPMERTVALFLASLYPGIGERHLAEQERMRRARLENDRLRAAAAAAEGATGAAMADIREQIAGINAAMRAEQEHAETDPQRSDETQNPENSATPTAEPKSLAHSSGETNPGEGSSSSVAPHEDDSGLTDRRGRTED